MAKKSVPPSFRNRVKELRYCLPSELADHPLQWRIHGETQKAVVQGILQEVGIAGALLAYESPATGRLTSIDGHLRKGLAETPWPTLILDLTDAEAALVLASYDPVGALATADRGTLATLLGDVQSGEAAVQQFLAQLAEEQGIVPAGVGNGGAVDDVEPQIDRAEELREQWDVEVGQLWGLGEHRVVCGDCRDKRVMERVLGGISPDAVVTDPPYGVGVDYASFKDSPGDVLALIGTVMPLLRAFEPIALTPGIPAMWAYPPPSWLMAWVHPAATSSGPWGFNGLNPILVYGDDPYLRRGLGRRADHIVMVADRAGVEGHPAPKPLKVWLWLVERLTVEQGAACYDPFLGSGTTILACEQLGRRCYACEIDPGYVAVTLERYRSATNKLPVRIA